ncbi:hypothetical protein E2C01_006078 [Portunus trituberculatus]|uniref:Uncharacterized protein n=1 Tax=Portunus trituberculatus TaxID=210409 RepID=A0A5B7CYB0_PORTR|nr:hypothetical protein [Portunus trituberculatus]
MCIPITVPDAPVNSDFPTACVATVSSISDNELGSGPPLSSLVNAVDYLELKHLLLDLLEEHRDFKYLPGLANVVADALSRNVLELGVKQRKHEIWGKLIYALESSDLSTLPSLHDNWEDWIPHVAAYINGSVCESTRKTSHYILYGVDKKLPYDLLAGPSKPVYNTDDYSSQHL